MVVVVVLLVWMLVFPLAALAQPLAPPSAADQLTQCQSLLRVKQDLPCRCDQAEQLAALLLKRAEKAEQELAEMSARATKAEHRALEDRTPEAGIPAPVVKPE